MPEFLCRHSRPKTNFVQELMKKIFYDYKFFQPYILITTKQFGLHLIQYNQAAAPVFILHYIGRQLFFTIEKKQQPEEAVADKD